MQVDSCSSIILYNASRVRASIIKPNDSINDNKNQSIYTVAHYMYLYTHTPHLYNTSIYMSRRLAPHVTIFQMSYINL